VEDIVLVIAVGIKNDRLTQDAGPEAIANILQERIEGAVLDLSWVTDMLVTKGPA